MALVPDGFVLPPPLTTAEFRLEPLGPQHNGPDHAAWTTSIDHIRATPGFAGRDWPSEPMSSAENEADLRRHAADFAQRTGFAYAVLAAPSGEYVGCIYFYPPRSAEFDVDVRSWVRHDRAHLDEPLHDAVSRWLSECWPWRAPDYAER
jgi:RimJ/RimL family protein N-acetyltransferase